MAASGALLVSGSGVLAACARAERTGTGSGSGNATLRINSFGGSFEKAIREAVVAPFEKDFNAKVSVTTALSSDALTKLKTSKGNPVLDVAYMDPAVIYSAKREGLLQRMDMAKIPNSKELHALAVDPDGYWIAELIAMTGIAYNTDKVKNPPTSWQDLWSPEYKGKVAISDVAGTAGYQFLVQAAKLNGGNEHNIDPGFEAIKRLRPNIVAYYKAPDEMSKLLSSGEAWLGPWYNDRMNALKAAGAPVGFVQPKEGAIAVVSAMCLPAGTKQADLAMKFINHQVSAKINGAFCTTMKESPTNKNVTLPSSLDNAIILRADADVAKLIQPDNETISAQLADWISRWQQDIAK
jgi:putative spermidine/putrescine transport system substrate-binding protein